MAHVSLYRKYRPDSFAQVVGQDHVTKTLARAVDSQSWHHAYLFCGPRGTGKTSSARLLAMGLNASTGPTSSPDPNDPIVVAIREGSCPDVIEIDAASNSGVDDVRDLRDKINYSPTQGRLRIYIVDECHMLSNSAWNAFLKTIEEPPGHVVFIFATTEPHKVLPTVLSRTQRFDFRRVSDQVLTEHCKRICAAEGVAITDEALAPIVRAGDGSVRDTLSVLDQVIAFTGNTIDEEAVNRVLGTVPIDLLAQLVNAIARADVAQAFEVVGQAADHGIDLRQFALDAQNYLRELLILNAAPEAGLIEGTPERLAELKELANCADTDRLLFAVETLNDAQVRMRSGNTRLPLEVALAKAVLNGADRARDIPRIEAKAKPTPVASVPLEPPTPSPVFDSKAQAVAPAEPTQAVPTPDPGPVVDVEELAQPEVHPHKQPASEPAAQLEPAPVQSGLVESTKPVEPTQPEAKPLLASEPAPQVSEPLPVEESAAANQPVSQPVEPDPDLHGEQVPPSDIPQASPVEELPPYDPEEPPYDYGEPLFDVDEPAPPVADSFNEPAPTPQPETPPVAQPQVDGEPVAQPELVEQPEPQPVAEPQPVVESQAAPTSQTVSPQPIPTPEPTSSAATTGEEPAYSLADITPKWDQVVAQIMGESPRIGAIYSSGQPARVDGNRIVIGFRYDFHAGMASEPDAIAVASRHFSTVLGTNVKVVTETNETAEPIAITPAAEEPVEEVENLIEEPGEQVDPDQLFRDAISQVKAELGAKETQ